MVFTIYPDSELGQPVRHTLESGDITCNVLVCYGADTLVTSVAAIVVKCVATCVECKATFCWGSCPYALARNPEIPQGSGTI